MNRKFKKNIKELKEKYEELNVYTNFKQYDLQLPEVMRMDSISSSLNTTEPFFDAIVCDPPYGIRAAQKMTGKDAKDITKREDKRDFKKEEKGLKDMYTEDPDDRIINNYKRCNLLLEQKKLILKIS